VKVHCGSRDRRQARVVVAGGYDKPMTKFPSAGSVKGCIGNNKELYLDLTSQCMNVHWTFSACMMFLLVQCQMEISDTTSLHSCQDIRYIDKVMEIETHNLRRHR